MDRFTLYPVDKHSPLWLRFKEEFLVPRLAELRMRNDGELDENETAKLRGRIAELKAILALEQDDPEVS